MSSLSPVSTSRTAALSDAVASWVRRAPLPGAASLFLGAFAARHWLTRPADRLLWDVPILSCSSLFPVLAWPGALFSVKVLTILGLVFATAAAGYRTGKRSGGQAVWGDVLKCALGFYALMLLSGLGVLAPLGLYPLMLFMMMILHKLPGGSAYPAALAGTFLSAALAVALAFAVMLGVALGTLWVQMKEGQREFEVQYKIRRNGEPPPESRHPGPAGKSWPAEKRARLMAAAAVDSSLGWSIFEAPAGKEKKAGFRDASGRTVIPPVFVEAGPFSHGLAPVAVDRDWWGYIDQRGAVAIKPRFTLATPFSEGLALVLEGGWWDFIDPRGNSVFNLSVDVEEAGPFREGLARIKVRNRWGYIDKTGEVVIPPQFAEAEDFAGGSARVKRGVSAWIRIDRREVATSAEAATRSAGP